MQDVATAPRFSFLLRLWPTRESGGSSWRASLEPVGMGPRVGFADVKHLFAYLTDQIEGQENPSRQEIHTSESESPDTYSPIQGDQWTVNSGVHGPEAASPYDILSAREEEILRLIGNGRTNKQIAQELSLSVRTIERYRSSIMRKAGLQNRAELVAYAVMQGLLSGTQGASK